MKVSKKRMVGATPVLAAAVLMVGLGASASASGPKASSKASGKEYTIDFVTSNTTDPFYFSMLNGAEAEAKKLGDVKIYWTGPETGGSSSTSQEVEIVNTLLAKHPAALVMDPQNSVALEPGVKKFDAAGIPVITGASALEG